MTRTAKNTKIWYVGPVGILALGIAVTLISLQPSMDVTHTLIRGAALLGYQCVFLAILSSAYLRQIVKFFGRPFVKVHHIVSVTGLVLITLHPIAVLTNYASQGLPVLSFRSWTIGGQIAWPLMAIAALAALFRKRIRATWRTIHYLNYIAFWLATIHANLAGTDIQSTAVRVISIAMAIAVLAVFLQVRRRTRPRKR